MLFGLIKSSVRTRSVANVFGTDNLRLGVIMARQETCLKFFTGGLFFGFVGKNNTVPAFMGWFKSSDEQELKDTIYSTFPGACITPVSEMDTMLDALENMMNR